MEPDWMKRARREIGVKERPGAAHHPRILEYQESTKMLEGADEVPWCSAFACWVMEQSGFASTRSAAARSWAKWGYGLTEPQVGCIVVLNRTSKDNPHAAHVGFYVGPDESKGNILVLGGNQANRVCIRPYDQSRVISYRWPVNP